MRSLGQEHTVSKDGAIPRSSWRATRLASGALAALAALSISAAATAATIVSFAGSFDLTQVVAPVAGSTIFGFDLGAGALSPAVSGVVGGFGYLNVLSGGGAWLVQNQPIPLSGLAALERNNVWFTDFTNAAGGSTLSLSAIVNDTPFLAAPTVDATWTTQAVTPGSTNWAFPDYAGQSGPPVPASPPAEPPPPPDTAKIEGYLRGGVGDIKQYWNECGPTSTANSLVYLAKKHGFENKLPTKPDGSIDQQALVLQLAQAMKPGFVPDNTLPDRQGYKDRGYAGLNGDDLKTGKEAYIKDKKLPLIVEGGNADPNASGAKTFDFVKKELRKGQDVEFLIAWPNDGYHWVTVVGDIDAGRDNKTLIVHDPLLANGNHYWRIKDDGTLTSPVGAAAWAVAESVVPEPSTWIVLVLGFGAMGASLRRRRSLAA